MPSWLPGTENSSEILRKCHHRCLQLVNFLLNVDSSILSLNTQVLLAICLTISGRLEDDVFHLLTHKVVDKLTGDVRQKMLSHFFACFLQLLVSASSCPWELSSCSCSTSPPGPGAQQEARARAASARLKLHQLRHVHIC